MSSSRSESGRRRGKSSRSGAKSRTPTAASSLPTELDELIAISREIGAQPDLVQGGGGNTSVKSRDGKRMFVKASGAALEDMSAERGWAELDRHLLDAIVNDTRLAELSVDRRELEMIRRLDGTVIAPLGARPSIEASLHALLDRVVIHTHPVGFNAILCSREGRKSALEALGDLASETIVVPYVDPGLTLARDVRVHVDAFVRTQGRLPSIVLLENHGVFVAADEPDLCLDLARRVARIGEKVSGVENVNPPSFDWLARSAPRAMSSDAASRNGGGRRAGGDLAVALRSALARAGAELGVVRADTSPLADSLLRNASAFAAAKRGAFIPDQIFYCRTRPLVLPRTEKRWVSAIAEYREQHGVDPRVAILPDRAVLYIAPNLAELRIVREVYRSAMATALAAQRFGGPRLLDATSVGFLESWEVERQRRDREQKSRGRLAGRVAVVTGAGSGLGKGIALGLANAGATVVGVDVDLEAVSEVARSRRAGEILALRCDVTSEESVDEAFESILESTGGIDFLVNAAGIAPSFPLVDFPLDLWRKSLEINLTGYFLMARAATRILVRQAIGGVIVNLTSKSGLEASKSNSAYNATKAGEIHLMRGWALELGRDGIRVNCVAPGNVFKGSKIWNPEYIRAAAKKKGIRPEEVIPYYNSLSALGKEIEPEDIANAVVFLCSDEARNITGQTIVVDGGQVMVR